MVARILRRAKPLGEQPGRTGLAAEGEHGEIEFSRTAGVRNGILLEEADALAKCAVASLPLHSQ